MGKCPKCGSYDVDVSADHKYTFECCECGRKWNPPKRKKGVKRADPTGLEILDELALVEAGILALELATGRSK